MFGGNLTMSGNSTKTSNQSNLESSFSYDADKVSVSEVLAFVLFSSSGTTIPECTVIFDKLENEKRKQTLGHTRNWPFHQGRYPQPQSRNQLRGPIRDHTGYRGFHDRIVGGMK